MGDKVKQTYQKVVTGEFYWKGNLEEYYQQTEVKVMPPVVRLDGKRMDGKIVIESWLVNNRDKSERDHFSIRVSSIGEFISLFSALVLAFRVYLRYTPANPQYLYNKLWNKFKEVWQGQYDGMIKNE